MPKTIFHGDRTLFCLFGASTLNSDHDDLYRQTKIPLTRGILFVVEVVGVEPTSYAAAKKLSTYLVYLLFLKFATRVNTLCKPQEAKYSYKNTSRFL